jgi:hypothetical protein
MHPPSSMCGPNIVSLGCVVIEIRSDLITKIGCKFNEVSRP